MIVLERLSLKRRALSGARVSMSVALVMTVGKLCRGCGWGMTRRRLQQRHDRRRKRRWIKCSNVDENMVCEKRTVVWGFYCKVQAVHPRVRHLEHPSAGLDRLAVSGAEWRVIRNDNVCAMYANGKIGEETVQLKLKTT